MVNRVRPSVVGRMLALVVAVAFAGCGGGDGERSAGGPSGSNTTDTPVTAAPVEPRPSTPQPVPDLPPVQVILLASGSTIDLRSLAAPGRPTLLWFWAPHCTFCRREAPELLRFAAEHGDDVDVLGVGAQDSLDQAHDFLDETRTAGLRMVWDPTGQSWVHYGVTNQPTVIVLGADGQVAGTWFRDFAPNEILGAAGVA